MKQLLKQIDSQTTESSLYGPEDVRWRKKIERTDNDLSVTVWRNGVIVQSFLDGNQERNRKYCAQYGINW